MYQEKQDRRVDNARCRYTSIRGLKSPLGKNTSNQAGQTCGGKGKGKGWPGRLPPVARIGITCGERRHILSLGKIVDGISEQQVILEDWDIRSRENFGNLWGKLFMELTNFVLRSLASALYR